MKIIIPKNLVILNKAINYIDGFIVGYEGLSVNVGYKVRTLDELIDLEKFDKKIYLSLNKNFLKGDLPLLENVLLNLPKFIEGVFFADIGVLNIKNKHKLDLNLIWSQEHFTTNFYTANFWYNEGVKGTQISNDISFSEIEEFISNANSDLYLTIFGYLPMFNSFRHLVNNYLDSFDKEKKETLYYMEEDGLKHPIIDDNNGTTVYHSKILNGLSEYGLLKNKKVNFIFDSFLIEDDKFIEVLKVFSKDQYDDKLIDELFPNTGKGFFDRKTVYRVKK